MPPAPLPLLNRGFLLLNAQLLVTSTIVALFFPLQSYLARLGIEPVTAGFIIGADALASFVVQAAITPFLTAANARRWQCFGALTLAAALLILSTAVTPALIIAGRLLQGAGFICVLASMIVMVVLYIPKETSGRAFGWISLVRLVPYAAVPPLFELLAISDSSFGQVLFAAAFLALAPILLQLPLPAPPVAAPLEARNGRSPLGDSLHDRNVFLLLLATLLLYSGYSTLFFFLKQFATGLQIPNSGLFFTISTLMMMAVRLAGGKLFDRYDKARLCAAALILVLFSCAALPFVSTTLPFYVTALFFGLGWGVAMPLQAAVMFDISSPNARGVNQNLIILIMQAGFFLGPFAGGWLSARSGFGGLFAACALAALGSAVAMLLLQKTNFPTLSSNETSPHPAHH